MGITQRLIGALDVLTGGSIGKYYLQAGIGLTGMDGTDDDKYRRLQQKNVRDYLPLQFTQIQKKAFYQWQRYPLAKRLIEILVDFCIGEEFHVTAKIMKRVDGEVDTDTKRMDAQQVWDDFFEDPINKLDSDTAVIVQDLFLNGELVLPVFVNTVDGRVRIGYIDPAYIDTTESVPMNAREVDTLTCIPPEDTKKFTLKVIRYDDDPNSETYEKLKGDAFYFRTNYVATQTRGHSELTDLLDWIDSFDQFLFNMVEGFNARNTFFFDLQMDGKTDADLKSLKVDAPTQGEVKVHNEKAKWTVQTPDLKAVDASAAVNLVKTSIIGSKGYPNHWFGDGSNTNLATADQMAIPTVRMVKRKQKVLKNMFKFMALYVLQNAAEYGRIKLADGEYFDVEVSMFDLERKDSAVIGTAFTSLVNALAVATSRGWASDTSAKKVVDGFMNMLGVEVDPNETPESIKAESDQKNAEETLASRPPVSEFMKKNGNGEMMNPNQDPSNVKGKQQNKTVGEGIA